MFFSNPEGFKSSKPVRLPNYLSDYISPCWMTTLVSTLIFLMMILLMVPSLSPSNSLRVPRCTHSNSEDLDNKTIHLVHHLYEWSQDQLRLLEKIKNEYEGYDVHLVLLRPWLEKNNDITKSSNPKQTPQPQNHSEIASSTIGLNPAVIEIKRAKRGKRTIRNTKRKKREHEKTGQMGIGFGMKSLLDILLHSRVENGGILRRNINDSNLLPNIFNITEPIFITSAPRPKTLDDVVCNFPGLIIRNVTFEEAFSKSPLKYSWPKLNPALMIFAVRVLHLWQYGGLSFKIDGRPDQKMGNIQEGFNKFSVAPETTLQTMEPNHLQILPIASHPTDDKLLNFILEGRKIFENLPKEVVTADDEGWHIFTKTPCHVFFGEILMNLKKARGDETPKTIIQKSLKVFCRHAAVGNNYCKTLYRRPALI